MTNYISLEGALNVRDIGGYSAEGGRLRMGRVYRSDNLNTLTDADLAILDDLGIRSVFDFRGEREVAVQPSRLWKTVEHHVHLPITEEQVQERTFVEKVEAGEITEVTDQEVGENYILILEERGHRFVDLLKAVADERHVPVLFHCTAGKDRTGLATALLHGLCGVGHEDIVQDFELSNKYRLPARRAELARQFGEQGIDLEPLLPAISAPPQAMRIALEHLDSDHSGIHGYVRDHLGVEEAIIDGIRRALIE